MTAQEWEALWDRMLERGCRALLYANRIGSEFISPDRAYLEGRTAFTNARLALDAYEALKADDDEALHDLLDTAGVPRESHATDEPLTLVERVESLLAEADERVEELAEAQNRRCGTCADWMGTHPHYRRCGSDTSECGNSDQTTDLLWFTDHGCPAWRAKEGA